MTHIKKYKKDIESIHLHEDEKTELFKNFQQFLKDNPSPIKSPYSTKRTLLFKMSTIITTIVLVVGISSYQAEASLPGDSLYSLKRNLNENVLKVLSFTDEQEAETYIVLTERRLKEVGQLLVEKRLEKEDAIELEREISENAEIINDHIQKNKNENSISDALSIAYSFQTVLESHDHIIESLVEDNTLASTTALSIQNDIDEHEEVIELHVDENTRLLHLASTTDKSIIKNAKDSLRVLKSILKDVNNNAVATSTLMSVQTAAQDGEKKIEEKNYVEAFIILEKATQDIQEAMIIEEQRHESEE